MKGAALALALLAAGCHRATPHADTPGDGLERAAIAAGLVSDPERLDPVGVYASDTDRVCVVPNGSPYRIGATVDYGEGQQCAAVGVARRRGDRLQVDFGGGCRTQAQLDGDHLSLPAELPAACDRNCTGRASLAALTAERLSGSAAEASALRDGHGRALCGG